MVSTLKTEVGTGAENEIASCWSDIDAVNALRQNTLWQLRNNNSVKV